jgi:hypothetical protein
MLPRPDVYARPRRRPPSPGRERARADFGNAILPRTNSSALISDLIGLLAADARQRRERAVARGGPARGWRSLVDVAAAIEALAASGAAHPRECAAMRRAARGQIARGATAGGAPALPSDVAERAARLLDSSDHVDIANAVVELGIAGDLAERHGRLLAEPLGIGVVEPVFRGRPEMAGVPDRSRLERVLIAPPRAQGGVRLCSVECYAAGVLARYVLDAERLDPGESASGTV